MSILNTFEKNGDKGVFMVCALHIRLAANWYNNIYIYLYIFKTMNLAKRIVNAHCQSKFPTASILILIIRRDFVVKSMSANNRCSYYKKDFAHLFS